MFTGATTKTNGCLGNVIINKQSGTLILKNYINSWGNWTYVNGSIDGQTYESSPNPTAVVFNYTSATGKLITGSHALYHVCFTASYTATIINIAPTTTLTVDGNLTWEGTYGLTVNGGNIDANKNVTVTNTGVSNGGTTTLNFKNGANQTLTGNNLIVYGALCHIKIDKSGGILAVKNKTSFGGNWTHLNGTLDLITDTPTIIFYGAGTITAKQDFYNLSFFTGTFEIPSASPVTVTHELRMENAYTININTGTINVTGDITSINEMTGVGGGNGLININGTGNQLFSGNNLAAAGNFCNITINKPSGVLTLANTISLNTTSTWRYIQGTVDPGTSTVSCMNGSTVNAGSTSSFMQFYNFYVSNGNNTLYCGLAGPLYVRNNLIVSQARTLTTNNFDITVGGNTSAVGIINIGTSTFTFNGSGRQNAMIGSNLSKVVVNKPSGKIYLDYYNLGIVGSLTLAKGVIVSTTSTSAVKMYTPTVVGGSNQSYVAGPLIKVGSAAFTFPLGDTTLTDSARYHPFSMTAPIQSTDTYTAQYFPRNQLTDHPTFTSYASTLKSISTCEYWSLTRNVGTSIITPTLAWNTNTCNINALTNVRVGSWDGTQWRNLGQNTLTGNSTVGTVKATTAGSNLTNQYYVIAELDPAAVPNHLYWVGNGSNKNWDVSANWSGTSGGPGGAPIPTPPDSVYFDGGGKGRLILNTNINIAKLTIDSTYNTDSIIQNDKTITIGGGGMILKGGTFWGGTALITNNGVFNLAGTNFRSTSSKLTIVGNYSFTGGSFSHNNGQVYFTTTNTISGNTNFYDVVFSPAAAAVYTIPLTDVLTVTGELKIEGASAASIKTGTINAKGNITITSAYTGTPTTPGLINICGNGDQTFVGNSATGNYKLCNVTINKPAGILYLSGNIEMVDTRWSYLNGTVDPGTSTMWFFGNGSVSCGTLTSAMYFNNFILYFGTVNLVGILNVKKDLTIYAARTLVANNYDVTVGGDFSGLGAITPGTNTVTFNGSGRQVANISSTLYNVKINKPSGKVYVNNYKLGIANTLYLVKGIFVSIDNASLVKLWDNATVDGGSAQSYVAGPMMKIGNDAFTFTLGDTTLPDTSAYHPFSITAPAVTTDSYTAQYYAHNQLTDHPTFTSYASTLKPVSTCEYWSLNRTVGTSSTTPTLGWNGNICNINALADVRVASWSGTQWTDLGQNSTTGTKTRGTVKANVGGANATNQYYALTENYVNMQLLAAYCNASIPITNQLLAADNNASQAFYRFEFSTSSTFAGYVDTDASFYKEISTGQTPLFKTVSGLHIGNTYYVRIRTRSNASQPWSNAGTICSVAFVNDAKLLLSQCDQSISIAYPPGMQTSDANLSYAFYRFEFSTSSTFTGFDANDATMYKELANGQYPLYSTVSGLHTGSTYYVRIRVRENSAESWSAAGPLCSVTFVNDAKLHPSQCDQNISIANPVGMQTSDANLSYAFYRFEFSTSSTFTGFDANDATMYKELARSQYPLYSTVSGLHIGSTYYVRIRVRENSSESWSSSWLPLFGYFCK